MVTGDLWAALVSVHLVVKDRTQQFLPLDVETAQQGLQPKERQLQEGAIVEGLQVFITYYSNTLCRDELIQK